MTLTRDEIEKIVGLALAEDLGRGDVTTGALIPSDQHGMAFLVVREGGVLAGIELAKEVFRQVDPQLQVEALLQDGARVLPDTRVARAAGSIAGILKSERVALNFLQHLSGIATETARYVASTEGLPVRIVDTRKTTPGLRALQKYAVRVGGGDNHRMDLADGILIKDNHLTALRKQGLTVKEAVARARQQAPSPLREAQTESGLGSDAQPGRAPVEVEVGTVAEALEAVEAGADIVMLDNMGLDDMRRAVQSIGGRAVVEASGGITLRNVRAVAETGVDVISVGALTHSVKALDISLDLEVR